MGLTWKHDVAWTRKNWQELEQIAHRDHMGALRAPFTWHHVARGPANHHMVLAETYDTTRIGRMQLRAQPESIDVGSLTRLCN